MIFRFTAISVLVGFIFVGYSLSQTKNDSEVIAKFDNQKITFDEFKNAYAKSGSGSGNVEKDSLSQLKNFLNLYVDYRMKLEDGLNKGFEKDPEILSEMKNYRDQIAYTLYTEKYIINPNIKALYEKRKWEYRASHIMFRPENGDTTAVLKLANAVLDSLKNGADFSKMALKYSADIYSKYNGGDLYYFTAGQLPLNIENAIIQTPVGQIYPKVIRSNFGYHIIKVTEKHERVPEIRASHILVGYNFDGKMDTARAKAIIDTVYQKLKEGADFDKLVHEYSTDQGTVPNNGDLGFFARYQMVRPFDEAAFNLKNVGDISGIVKSPFGYHIIKLTGKMAYPSFDEDKAQLVKIFKARQYYDNYDKLVDSLSVIYNLKENKPVVNYIASIADTTKGGFDIKNLPDTIKSQLLFSLPGNEVTVNDFINMVRNQSTPDAPDTKGVPFKVGMKRIAGEYLIIEDALNHFSNDSTFKSLMDEYEKGAIIFKLQQDEVWNKINADSASLLNYYQKNINKYKWPDRSQFTELFTMSDSLIHHYQDLINKGENFDTLCAKYTERPGYKQRAGHWTLRDKDHNNLYQLAWSMNKIGQYSDIFKNFGGYSIIRLDDKDHAREKTFEEAKAEVSSDFQEMRTKQLQQAYLEKLNKKFKPEIDYKKFEELLAIK